MEQYTIQSSTLKDKTSIAEVFDLLLTDLEVECHNDIRDDLSDVEALLKVGMERNAAADLGQSKETMKDMLDRLKVDVEIETMGAMQDYMKLLPKKIASNLAASSKSNHNTSDEMDVLMHLYHVDLDVSRAKHDASFNALEASTYQALWLMDVAFDNLL
jgi:hypothetical protein